MKTPKPKVTKPAVKDKFTAPKSGKIQKSLGNAPAKKLSAISSLKSADQALKIIKENESNVELKVKNKKKKGGSPDNVAAPQGGKGSPKVQTSQVNPGQKGDKKKGKGDVANQMKETPVNGIAPSNKKLKKVMNEVENNTSPFKVATDSKKKVKVPLKIDAPVMTPTKKGQRPETGNKSPEVILGLQLEKALSPKSKNKKKSKLLKDKLQTEGKVEVTKKKAKAPAKPASTAEDGEGGKKKRNRRRRKGKKGADVSIAALSMFDEMNATNAVKALLKTSKAAKSDKKELFSEDKFVYLQVNLLKGSDATKSVLHMVLPHSILPESPEICLITPDLKGKRNDPDEAIDFYKDLLRNKGIDYVSEIVPIRKLKKEYSAFEQRRAMANRFDAVIADGKVTKFARLGRRFAPTKKCVCAVKLDADNLKVEFDKALRKVAMFSNGRGLSFSIKCGREGMPVNQIAENIMVIGKYLAADKIVIGNIKNVGSVYVKTALSSSFPVYVSTVTPNDAPYPEGKKRKAEEPVEDEVTTVMDGTVVVHPTGNVRVKKQKGAVGIEDDEEPPVQKKSSKNKEGKKPIASGDDSEDDSEAEIDFDNLPSDFEVDDSDMGEEGSEFEEGSEVGSEMGEEEDSEVGEEGSEGESGEGSDEDEEEDEEATDDADEDSDSAEGEIADAEMQYLQEVRKMQDGFAKKKKALGKMPEKEKPKGKPAQLEAAPQKPEGKAKAGKKGQESVEVAQKKGGKGAAAQKGAETKQAGAKGSPANENKFQKNKQQNQNKNQEDRQGNQQSPKNKFDNKQKFGNKEANKGAIGKNNAQPQKPMGQQSNQQKNFEKKGNQKFNKGSPGGPDKGKFEKKKNAGEAKFSVKKPFGGKKFNK